MCKAMGTSGSSNGCWYPQSFRSLCLLSLWRVPPREADLFVMKPQGQRLHEHWTNIHRMRFLAQQHPQIETVRAHKSNKGTDPSSFDVYGRAVEYHQSPFDLHIILAASGAEMYVGVTVNKIKKQNTPEHRGGLIALWWSGPAAPSKISAVAEAVFFDICELGEKIPNCALGRAMLSRPAASASGGQAASSSGPPPTSATPPSESQPTAAEPQPLEGETAEIFDAPEADVPESILEGPHPEAKATSSGPSPQPLAGITEGEAGAKEESHSLPLPEEAEAPPQQEALDAGAPRTPKTPPPEPPQRKAEATVPVKAISEADSSAKASAP